MTAVPLLGQQGPVSSWRWGPFLFVGAKVPSPHQPRGGEGGQLGTTLTRWVATQGQFIICGEAISGDTFERNTCKNPWFQTTPGSANIEVTWWEGYSNDRKRLEYLIDAQQLLGSGAVGSTAPIRAFGSNVTLGHNLVKFRNTAPLRFSVDVATGAVEVAPGSSLLLTVQSGTTPIMLRAVQVQVPGCPAASLNFAGRAAVSYDFTADLREAALRPDDPANAYVTTASPVAPGGKIDVKCADFALRAANVQLGAISLAIAGNSGKLKVGSSSARVSSVSRTLGAAVPGLLLKGNLRSSFESQSPLTDTAFEVRSLSAQLSSWVPVGQAETDLLHAFGVKTSGEQKQSDLDAAFDSLTRLAGANMSIHLPAEELVAMTGTLFKKNGVTLSPPQFGEQEITFTWPIRLPLPIPNPPSLTARLRLRPVVEQGQNLILRPFVDIVELGSLPLGKIDISEALNQLGKLGEQIAKVLEASGLPIKIPAPIAPLQIDQDYPPPPQAGEPPKEPKLTLHLKSEKFPFPVKVNDWALLIDPQGIHILLEMVNPQ